MAYRSHTRHRGRLLLATHEDLERTPVARAMFGSLIPGLTRAGWACTLLSASTADGSFETAEGRRLLFRRTSRGRLGLDTAPAALAAARLLASEMKRADVVLVRSYPMMMLTAPLARLLGKPVIFDTRGLFFHELADSGVLPAARHLLPMLQLLERALVHQSAAVVSVTESQAAYYRRLTSGAAMAPRSVVLYNAVRPPDRPPDRASPGPVVGYVGSLGRWHLPERTFQIMSLVQRDAPDVEFHVVTEDLVKARSLADQVGLERIRVYRRDFRVDPVRFDLGLCLIDGALSKRVCFPVKLAEYAASGTPVLLSANLRTCQRLVRSHGLGYVVDLERDDHEIAAVILRALHGREEAPVTGGLPEELLDENRLRRLDGLLTAVLERTS